MTGGFAAVDGFAVAFAFDFAFAFGEIADGLPHPAPLVPLGGVVGAPSRAADMMQASGFLTVRNLSICAHL